MSSPYDGQSIAQSVPGISGENTTNGTGVSGSSQGGYGVEAISTGGIGLHAKGVVVGPGKQLMSLPGQAAVFDGSVVVNGSHTVNGNAQVNGTVIGSSTSGVGVHGESQQNDAISGIAHDNKHSGVFGTNDSGQGSGITGACNSSGNGVSGSSTSGNGLLGYSVSGVGVHGESQQNDAISGIAHDNQHSGVFGTNDSGLGSGVTGSCNSGGNGVSGSSASGNGVLGKSATGVGVWGESTTWDGVHGVSHSVNSGVAGINDNAQGGTGVWGESTAFDGVHGVSHSAQHAGVAGINAQGGYGVYGQSTGGSAGYFEGNVVVTGDITLTGADFAEEFDVTSAEAEPGTVMVLDRDGALHPSQQAYDKKVAGVISGAGNYKPGMILDKKESSEGRMPVALVGKVYCKVDAKYISIEVGDLLTTSPTPGHAMKAVDPLRAFGAVIGKALQPLDSGQGLIPVLIALQ